MLPTQVEKYWEKYCEGEGIKEKARQLSWSQLANYQPAYVIRRLLCKVKKVADEKDERVIPEEDVGVSGLGHSGCGRQGGRFLVWEGLVLFLLVLLLLYST